MVYWGEYKIYGRLEPLELTERISLDYNGIELFMYDVFVHLINHTFNSYLLKEKVPFKRMPVFFHCCLKQESPAVADKPARRLRKVRTVYVRAVGL